MQFGLMLIKLIGISISYQLIIVSRILSWSGILQIEFLYSLDCVLYWWISLQVFFLVKFQIVWNPFSIFASSKWRIIPSSEFFSNPLMRMAFNYIYSSLVVLVTISFLNKIVAPPVYDYKITFYLIFNSFIMFVACGFTLLIMACNIVSSLFIEHRRENAAIQPHQKQDFGINKSFAGQKNFHIYFLFIIITRGYVWKKKIRHYNRGKFRSVSRLKQCRVMTQHTLENRLACGKVQANLIRLVN